MNFEPIFCKRFQRYFHKLWKTTVLNGFAKKSGNLPKSLTVNNLVENNLKMEIKTDFPQLCKFDFKIFTCIFFNISHTFSTLASTSKTLSPTVDSYFFHFLTEHSFISF